MTHASAGDRLTAEDAVFLYFETEEMPLHIGSVCIFEGVVPFEPLVKYVDSRLPLIPRYRQRLVVPPFHAGHPTWEPDPDFDIRNHIFSARLKRGTEGELRAFSAKVFGRLMDRGKPLWDLVLVEGLTGGRCALIARVHHCLVDGVSGVGLMNVLLNAGNFPTPTHPKRKPARARRLPGAETAFADALASSYSEALDRILAAQTATLNIVQSLASDSALTGFRQLVRVAPELLAPVERLPFNRPLTGPRRLAWTEFSLAEFKAIKEACQATVNDVALAVLTGAIRRYAELHRVPLRNRRLRVMVPVNVRTKENDNGYGNRVSMLPVTIPLDVRDPVELLRAIHESTDALKNAHVAELIGLFGTWIGTTPAPVQALLGPMARFSLPSFNLVCTNVPGPQFPLYALGHEMLTYYPYVPIGSEMGIGCAIQSYNQRLYFGLTGDAGAAPDIDRLKHFLDQTFVALRKGAGVARTARPKARAKASVAEQPAPAIFESLPVGPTNGVPLPAVP